MARLKNTYLETIVPKLMKENNYSSIMEVPRLTKITINIGMGEAIGNPKALDAAMEDLTKITGQKPVFTKAKKSISNFKLREGARIGVMVTLRREKMYEFLDRLMNVSIPRIRDFRGISAKSFDGRGNFNMGIREQLIFPEIDYDKIDKIRGMNISITTTAKNDDECRQLLTELGMPFRK
ncbi:MAG: 50S ribosomal protein L5 [candidate division Zixibacteria bacterium HGW-Zixibacteria-1]|nr:ribosomal protein L5 [uncultured bacterium]PKK84595.1 MAG: 50S ribosomal protein L5 [candidate division Zixibacteria bacterium HGW-Zixibacteria-1]